MFVLIPCSTHDVKDTWLVPDYHLDFSDENYGIYATCWTLLLSDSPLGSLRPKRLIRRFYVSLVHNFAEVAKTYATLYDVILRNIGPDSRLHLNGEDFGKFKHLPIAKEIISLCAEFDPMVLQYVLTFLSFGKRSPSADPDALQAVAFRSWLEVEDRLEALELPEWVDDLKTIINTCVEPYFDHVALPSHGPGKVAERGISNLSDKHKCVDSSSYAVRAITDWGMSIDPSKILPAECTTSGELSVEGEDDALLSFVNKNVSTLRSICQEPAKFMYTQKSVEFALVGSINKGPFRRFTRLEDQNHNRILAREGSFYRTVDTIDLSAASDSLSLQLVKRIFPRKILKYLLGTRSRRVKLPDGTVRKVYKFAPMGAATCFPTQCIVFASVVLLAYHRYAYNEVKVTPSTVKALLRVISDDAVPSPSGMRAVRVYGDDIICDTRVTSILVEMLHQLGFRVNSGKSFVGETSFRESCGGYYADGFIVKPVSLKSDFTDYKRPLGAKVWSLASLAVRAFQTGYNHLASYAEVLAKTWRISSWEGIRVIYPGPGGLDYYNRFITNDHCFFPVEPRKRLYGRYTSKQGSTTCERFQRDECMYVSLKVIAKPDQGDDVYSLIQWYRSPNRSFGYTPDVVQSDPELQLRPAWKPV